MNARHLVSPRSLVLSTAIALLATHSSGPAAQTAPVATAATAPRIGLALSGGGARGLAHVGVLKVLEELRVPIHCVTGTSMGAIVGGTFAAGTSPAEMEKIVLAADWAEIFRDRPPREEIAIQRKIDDYKTLFAPEFGVKDGGLALPKGVIAGVSIESFFRVLATRAFGVTDFRKLPIPFRGGGDRHRDRRSVVLERGGVAQAMRASMSVPGAHRPGRDRRTAAGRRRHRQQPADRRSAQAVRRRGDRRQHLDAAPEAQGHHLRAVGRRAAGQLSRQADGRRAAEEPRQQGRADRARSRRHLGRHVRSLRRSGQDRRAGDARVGRLAPALQPAARSVRGIAGHADRRGEGVGLRRGSPVRRAGTFEPRGVARPGREQARRAAVSEAEDRCGSAARLPQKRQVREHRYHISGEGGPRMVIGRRRIVGPRFPALRPRPRERLPG
ncbi:MAG: patatin-like phospholipase family protein, partial [Betaproteobacteria bacterium]|nr:patatin-like phospholipase family protein [Betaproteobacteria bacterium]